MPVLCDFVVIQGDSAVRIGDGAQLWEKTFNTGGRHSGGLAFLIFNVKGLTSTDQNVDVKINNTSVGSIRRYEGGNRNFWFTQMINIGSGILNSGDNEIQIQAVGWPGAEEGNLFDDFYLQDVICFFQQAS